MKRRPEENEEMKGKRKVCPYVDTVDRSVIDFDKEKICCKTLSTNQIYCCMVCGKYFQGRGIGTPAYEHSLEENHHIFLSVVGKQFYNLPSGDVVVEPSFNDIIMALDPQYSIEEIKKLDSKERCNYVKDHFNKSYLSGFIGFNNLGKTDYLNSVIQCVGHCKEVRDTLLNQKQLAHIIPTADNSEFLKRMSLLVRKQWNLSAIKSIISPYELASELNRIKKGFSIEKQGDVIEFCMFLINSLMPITQHFQGELQIEEESRKVIKKCVCVPLDLPAMPLYPDKMKEKIIPQLFLDELLRKYDGATPTIIGKRSLKYNFIKLPKYLTFVIKRFEKNTYLGEKNITIVEFEETLDMSSFVSKESPKQQTQYHLISAIRHNGNIENGHYSAFVKNDGNKRWYEMMNEEIKEAFFQLIKVSDICLLIYEQDN